MIIGTPLKTFEIETSNDSETVRIIFTKYDAVEMIPSGDDVLIINGKTTIKMKKDKAKSLFKYKELGI